MRIIVFLLSFFIFFTAQAKNLATISYSGKKGPVIVNITLQEFLKTYKTLKQIAPNTPPAKQFFQEYLRYRIGVEQAYNDPSLIKNPSIKSMFADPLLKESFEDTLYKHLVEKKLKKKIAQIDRKAKKLSKNIMLKFYRNNPEFDLHFIVISFSPEPNKSQLKEAKSRAMKIYKEVKKSKKPFPELVDIYSDDRLTGRINLPRSQNTIYPTIYKRLKKMKDGEIMPPIKTPTGFYIVKLNRKIPFGEANQTQIKAAYFDRERGRAIKRYFNSLLKSKFKVKTNLTLLNKVR